MISSDALPLQAFTDLNKVRLTRTMSVAPADTRHCRVDDMAVLPSSNLLVADGWNQSLKVMDMETGNLLSNVQLPAGPYSLCLLPGDRAAVSLPAKRVTMIQIIEVPSDQLYLLDSVYVQGDCRGLAFMNNTFIVGLSDQQCVASINIDGKHLKSISKDNTGNKLFKYPWNICITTEMYGPSIYVSDCGTHTISGLSELLEVLQTFTVPYQYIPNIMTQHRPHNLTQFRQHNQTHYGPYGLAAAGGGQLLVRGWDRDSTRLWVLDTSTGVFTERLEGRANGFWYGERVAFCPRLGRVYVNAEELHENDYISVFEIS